MDKIVDKGIKSHFCKNCGIKCYSSLIGRNSAIQWAVICKNYWDLSFRLPRGVSVFYCHDSRCSDPEKALFHLYGSNLDYLEKKYKEKKGIKS